MAAWWSGLSLMGRIFSAIAIPATLIMVLQTILLLFADGDADTDVDTDADFDPGDVGGDGEADFPAGDGLRLLTVRGIVAFFAVGGWTGVWFASMRRPLAVTVLAAAAAGFAALYGVAYLFRQARKLQSSGNLDLHNAIGLVGQVYIPIPPRGCGRGKINLIVQERLCELDAENAGDIALKSGESVVVCGLADGQTVVVKSEYETNKGGISKWNLN